MAAATDAGAGASTTPPPPRAPLALFFVGGRGEVADRDAASPPRYMKHRLCIEVPMPTRRDAETVARVLSVDRPLRHHDVHVAYHVVPSASPTTETPKTTTTTTVLRLVVHTTTVRHLRLVANSVCEDARLVVDTLHAFPADAGDADDEADQWTPRAGAAGVSRRRKPIDGVDEEGGEVVRASDGQTRPDALGGEELELGSVGRAG